MKLDQQLRTQNQIAHGLIILTACNCTARPYTNNVLRSEAVSFVLINGSTQTSKPAQGNKLHYTTLYMLLLAVIRVKLFSNLRIWR